MSESAYRLARPARLDTSVVFSSPHSGRDYALDFLRQSVLDDRTIRSSEDAFVDLLYSEAPRFGAPLLTAVAPRAYVDLNRDAVELDPAVVEGARQGGHNPRISSGLGVIPRVVANGRAIYRGKIPLSEANARLSRYWRPYHAQLQALLRDAHDRFGEAILLDCHSMPRDAIETVTTRGRPRPDIVLGDRFGASAGAGVVDRVEAAFRAAGLRVSRNMPFAGAYITQRYGRPARGCHVVQVEIDRALYMDETLIRPSSDFAGFRRLMGSVTADLAQIGRAGEHALPLAAE
ncbi:N-formylglutamate amidohydrolase [Rhodovulum bhavnagarense]|uniref:N-formylglutamate amidohydrolase n=1 Tax=Rhodovulum bhavnagarense TaxID=992286 RepID=A0A4V6NRL1_9RHOB|nr:N-formylglutamate amidohydrolase [Rhodovulum bhavnagarense]TCP61666.1 N-formylglutamate amidohydrolase [Rhodovulum bhavnagarense]